MHDLVGGRDHLVDRDGAVRIAEQPVVLVALDPDRGLVGRGSLRRIRDPRQLPEDEGADHRRGSRPARPSRAPRAASSRGSAGLRRPRALAAPVLDDEEDQRALDDQEDDAGEDRDEDERAVDPVRVRRMRLRRAGSRRFRRTRSPPPRGRSGSYQEWQRRSGARRVASYRAWKQRSRVELPPEVGDVFEVFVNGVPQQPGVDFDQVGRSLVFQRSAGGGGQARVLAVGEPLLRGRRHLPPKRRGRRRVRRGRAGGPC